MDPVSALAYHAQTADPSAQPQLLPATAKWEDIMAQEHALAHQWFQTHGMAETSSPSPVVIAHETPPVAICQPTLQQNKVATATTTAANGEDQPLPLQSFVTKPEILKRARSVDFDAASQRYTAVWQKPGPFDFGMVLKPALGSQMAVGESYSFETQGGVPASISRDSSGQIWLKQGGANHEMSSSDLRELLDGEISVNGMNLSLDQRGNLVLVAQGENALAMASIRK